MASKKEEMTPREQELLETVQELRRENALLRQKIADHKEVAKGTLRSLIRWAGITVDEFTDQL